QEHGFDGINLDWNYPSGQAERTKFTELCKELRTAFTIQSLLLTASVSGMKTIIDDGYEVSLIAPELDFINVLTYNFHSSTESATAHHSPLSSNPSDTLTTARICNDLLGDSRWGSTA
ncbi:chitinase-3-like protein 1, partial [Boleophthalmus pectinirostris]|uniref:chitinase-3-like protein 1 n=1 Tax=Boleophthalmus pectinirostris TaxID=150288 RepID=UPI00242D4443